MVDLLVNTDVKTWIVTLVNSVVDQWHANCSQSFNSVVLLLSVNKLQCTAIIEWAYCMMTLLYNCKS